MRGGGRGARLGVSRHGQSAGGSHTVKIPAYTDTVYSHAYCKATVLSVD